ncbi:MAG: hypothetical protein QNJ44_11215 [Rhodobacter sp.]|nr:hypothetical protein [Rhodobacter sp.]
MPAKPDRRLTIRFTPEEYAEIAAKAGSQPVSSFLRETVLCDAASRRKSRTPAPIKDHGALAQVLALLGTHALTTTFKSAARAAENGTFVPDELTEASIATGLDALQELKSVLMRALGVTER